MAESIKISFLTYFKNLGLYDYLGLAWFSITFLVLIILAIVVAKRSSSFSLLLIVLSLIFFIAAPFALKYKLNTLLRPYTIEIQTVKKLTFSDAVIVEATLLNNAAKPFRICLIQTKIIKKSSSASLKSFLNTLKPLANQSIVVQSIIPPGETLEFKTDFNGFLYSGEIDATMQAECY